MSYKKQTWAVSEQAKPEKMKHIEDGIAANETAISGCEKKTSRVTSITEESTDSQYPTAKAVYNLVMSIPTGSDGVITPNIINSDISMEEGES